MKPQPTANASHSHTAQAGQQGNHSQFGECARRDAACRVSTTTTQWQGRDVACDISAGDPLIINNLQLIINTAAQHHSDACVAVTFGENFVSQRLAGAPARYTFSACRGMRRLDPKDSETGYSYFGARYYESGLSVWLSVDPLADNYPSLSSYVYCANNPVILVDPDGRRVIPFGRIFAMVTEFYGPSSKIKQVGYAMQFPIKAIKVGSYKNGRNNFTTISSNFEINIAKAAGLTYKKEGDQGNAYRHTLWQAILTNEFGEDHARRIGNTHEDNSNADLNKRTFNDMGEADQVVDLLNNQIGRKIANENRGANNKELAEKVADEFYQNGLWTATKNKDGSTSISKTKITKEQHDTSVKLIRTKGNDGLDL